MWTRIKNKSKTRLPVEAFKKCPRCSNTDLQQFEAEVFCTRCDWDSVDLHAQVREFTMGDYINERRLKPSSQGKAIENDDAVAPDVA